MSAPATSSPASTTSSRSPPCPISPAWATAAATSPTLLDHYADNGVENILALGGDPPADGSDPGGEYEHASQLVEQVRAHPAGFSVGVAAHPEVHPRSPDRESDRRHLAAKLEAADFAMSQFFFAIDDYLRMVDELAELGCDKPVLPGVMPFISLPGLVRMAGMNGSVIPQPLLDRLDLVADQPDEIGKIGIEVATELGAALLAEDAPGLHLYALNRSAASSRSTSTSAWADDNPQGALTTPGDAICDRSRSYRSRCVAGRVKGPVRCRTCDRSALVSVAVCRRPRRCTARPSAGVEHVAARRCLVAPLTFCGHVPRGL